MKLTMARSELVEHLGVAGRALSSRSTLPILSGILVTSSTDGSVVLQATDLEVSVRSEATALVEKEGSVVLPGKLVTDIVRSLPEAAITIDVSADHASIMCGQASFTVKTLSPEDFPRFPELDPDKTIEVPTKEFTNLSSHVVRAVSRDETRPILTGVLLVFEGPTMKMVATDSYRLAVKEVVLQEPSGEEAEIVVPGKVIEEISRLASSAKKIQIGVSENQVVFAFDTTTLVTRRIEGTFPNYRQLIPREFETEAVMSKDEFAQAIKRVSLLAQHNTPLRLTVSVEDQTISLSATTQDVGDASEDIPAKIEGQDVEIAFNHGFLTDGVGAIQGDTAKLSIVSSLKPGVLTSTEDEGFLGLLMPVRLS